MVIYYVNSIALVNYVTVYCNLLLKRTQELIEFENVFYL